MLRDYYYLLFVRDRFSAIGPNTILIKCIIYVVCVGEKMLFVKTFGTA